MTLRVSSTPLSSSGAVSVDGIGTEVISSLGGRGRVVVVVVVVVVVP
jgi:hypothetical protein